MNLIETTTLNSADFPIVAFRDYLRLGSGFTDDGAQDAVLETCLRAAMGAIEARTTKILLSREFQWVTYSYRLEDSAAVLPVSPVSWLKFFSIVKRDGALTSIPRTDFVVQSDRQRERILPINGTMPEIPDGGFAKVTFYAGYGPWADVLPALQQAMLMLAASYYENRDAMLNGGGQMPLAVATLLAPYQRIRLGAGA